MITEIIPYKKLPRNLDIFDYKIDDAIQDQITIGKIVIIPFRNKKILGVVSKIKTTSNFKKLKKITEVTPYSLSENNIKSLYKLATHYINAPSLFLKNILPVIPKKNHKITKQWTDLYNWNFKKDLFKTLEKTPSLEKSLKDYHKRYLILSNNEQKNYALYLNLIKKHLKKKNKQLMLLFPNIQKIENFLQYLPLKYQEKISIISNKIVSKKNLYFKEWLKIQNNKVSIIIGTRSAIFMPLDNINTLIIDQAEGSDYKQTEPNPRYHTVDIAYLNQDFYKYKLILNSLNPRFLDYFLSSKQEDYKIINDYQTIEINSHWINMKEDIYDENKHPLISEKAETAIKENLNDNKKVLILHNKKGFANQVKCKKCNNIFKCPKCKQPYQYQVKNKTLYCHNCQTELKKIYCPKCKSTEWQLQNYGIKHLQKYWEKLGYSNIAIEYKNYTNKELETIKEKIKNKHNLIISTNFIFSITNLKSFDFILITNTDQLLATNDFNANWQTFKNYNSLIQKCASYNITAYFQTYHLDNFIFQTLKKQQYNKFYQQELKWRQQLNYPPFKPLIKIVYQNRNNEQGEKIVKRYYRKLKHISSKETQVASPYPIYRHFIQRKNFKTYKWIIIIKSNYKNLQNNSKLYNFLENLPPEWLIDINPENLYK